MARDWKHAVLRDLVEIKHGYAFQGQFFRDDPPGSVLVTPGNFHIGGGFNSRNVRYYAGDVPAEFELFPDDLIVSMTDLSKGGDTLGYSALVPKDGRCYLHNQRIGKILLRPNVPLHKNFAYWLLRSPAYRSEVLGSATGSTVRHTSPSRIGSFQFYLPPFSEQAVIAELLDALDDKIDLNRRMAETMEAMARALFQSWFVDFDPVHAKRQSGQTGLSEDLAALFPDRLEADGVPAEWVIASLGNIVSIERATQDPTVLGETLVDHFSLPAFDAGRRSIREPASAIKSLKVSIKPPLVLFSKLNPETPRVWPVLAGTGKTMFASTEFLALRPRPDRAPLSFVASLLASNAFRDKAAGMVTGTSKSHQRVQPGALLETTWIVPTASVLAAFDEIASPMLSRAEAARNQSDTLATLRKTLLPRLISGELRMADAEKRIAAA